MRETTTVFEQRWSVWLSTLSGIALIISAGLALWLQLGGSGFSTLPEPTRESLLSQYNAIAHGGFFAVLAVLAGLLMRSIAQANPQDAKPKPDKPWPLAITDFIKQHPVVTIVLTIYVVLMVQESSWFYKEILTWYDDIFSDQLLNNFSLREKLINETMGRNDFRFFPLSHQDLHALSWLTPYIKVWSLVSALELIATIILGCKLIERVKNNGTSAGLMLMGTLLFLFTSASAYNYFQFIYSERFLTFLLALYAYHYSVYLDSGRLHNGRLALLFALFIPFFKDTAVLLAVIPAATTIVAGSLGAMPSRPAWGSTKPSKWMEAYALDIAIVSLALFFLASFAMLSGLPSLAADVPRYDEHLGFSVLALDIRLIIFLGFIASRLWLIGRKHANVTALDGLNLAALAYGFALYALVGLEGSNYMSLPIQFVAVLDILMIWESLIAPKLNHRMGSRQAQAVALGTTLLLLNIEDRQAATFRQRAQLISWKQRSWRTTLNEARAITERAKENGETVNLIYSKGWFKHSDQMKALSFDRLVYYDIDTRRYIVKAGIGKGEFYTPQPGDYLVDIDTGKKLTQFGIDLSNYDVLYQEDPNRQYARIFRHR
ncbi:hypothetical protein KR52_01630 [Synechococcus sp. KORDI-52]|uniref:hypothetical protein n=1 Tax=Synechococcus sp. KORDI-52 TaxID=585425 RepID=UPI0004E07254|nr:hypothetical protein [Synechococcus sp. KORDI-52]AII47863.1 hypothetical protein KR52_01630 [Synechococcus sp. KORDI-52]